jgi:hypothetical protein
MKSKSKAKTPKSSKARLSDLAPRKNARGGKLPEAPRPDGGPSYLLSKSVRYKKLATA